MKLVTSKTLLLLLLLNIQGSCFAFAYKENRQNIENKIFVKEGNTNYKYQNCDLAEIESNKDLNDYYQIIINLNNKEFDDFISSNSLSNNALMNSNLSFNLNLFDKISFKNYESYFISKTLPILIYNYDKIEDLNVDINKLSSINNTFVNSVYILKNSNNSSYEDETLENILENNKLYDDGEDYPINEALSDIEFDFNTKYDGTGVKIGFIESGIPKSEYLNDVKYVINPDSTYRTSHASQTLSIVKMISPQSDFYFVSFTDAEGNDDYTKYMNCIDWLVSQNVNVINCSFGSRDSYNLLSAYTDKIISNYNISFVAASGNTRLLDNNGEVVNGIKKDKWDAYCCYAPSNSYNTISVGSSSKNNYVSCFSTNGFKFNDITFNYEKENSGYNSNVEFDELMVKPDIIAPGDQLTGLSNFEPLSGTSFSTPFVTGIVSLLMQKDSNYKKYPELVKSTLINSTNKVRNSLIFDREAGFGIISFEKAMNTKYFYPISNVSHDKILDVFYNFNLYIENTKEVNISVSSIYNSNGELDIEFPKPDIYGFTSFGQKIGESKSVYYAAKFRHSNFSGNLNFIFQLLNRSVPNKEGYRYCVTYQFF